jgi:nuclear pore complex protein Nup107
VLAHEDNDDDDDDGNDDSTRTDTHPSRTGPRPETSDPRDAMHDLREMAERVGREVEDFAENLDKFLEELPTRNQSDAVLKLVDEFKAIASDAAYRMELDHRKERASLLRKEWSDRAAISTADGGMMAKGVLATSASLRFGGSLSGSRRELVELQRKWQQEADIWDLFRIMLELHYSDREVRRREVEAKLAGMGSVHRYTSEKELWDRFLLTDDLARERNLVKKWLEQTVDHQESDLAGIVEELESKSAGRGRGLWGHGWMHTREMIKHEKRLRNWPEPDAEPLPQLKRSDNPDPLITSLDPDAVTRQNRTLEKADSYFERATWIACWEMLRRGTSWEDVSEWCRERNEGWRAISIGKGADPSEVPSLSAWRKMCYLASQSGGCSDYEAAVYGLLGGNINAMQKVCRTLDDRLYANYSGYLVRKFDQYLSSTFPDRAPLARRGATEETLQDPEQAMYDLLSRLRKEPTTGAEAVKPLKIIQSYLIANDVGSMIHTLGHAISFTDQQRNQGERSVIARLQPFWRDGSQNQPEEEIALDTQALRIATHMSILLDTLSPPNLRDLELHAAENVTIAYIQTLRAAGKRDLIPVYASRLSQGAYVSAMGHVMQDITNEKEQGDMLSLLKQYNLNVVLILNTQLGLVLDACLANDVKQDEKPLNIVEGSHEGYHPSQRVRQGFVPQSPSEEDVSIVASLRWYNILEGQWEHAFGSLALALRKALSKLPHYTKTADLMLMSTFSCRSPQVRPLHHT